MDDKVHNPIIQRQQALKDAQDAFILQRGRETADLYLPFSALVEQYESLFGEKLELPGPPSGVVLGAP